MKTVKQQAEVSFKLLDFADKVVMLPLMDSMAISIKKDECFAMNNEANYIEQEHTKKIFKVLSDLDCRTSLGESYEDIIKSHDLQEKTKIESKKHILQLSNFGPSKLETVKIIKESLSLGLKEAKDLVDSCPITINLREYRIKESEYEALLYLLLSKDCECNLI